jgi:radical SAM-linked protein
MRMPRYIDPVRDIGGLLLEVEKPDRYTGGEFGRLANSLVKKDTLFRALIAFPDLYEIGMSGQALRIIYNRLNGLPGISCDRAFAPAPDFEKLLREKAMPLYGLDTGISLVDVDLLLFTLGYELGINGVLTMLDVSGIPIHCAGRNDSHPVVIAGGPAVSNPLPYSPFIDAFWIGEAEAGFFDLAGELARLKKSGEGRAAMIETIASHPNVWVRGKTKAIRAVAPDLAGEAAVFPVPSMKIVHHHGTVEIMRGCPNGCRFCHAGFWYRPMRQKKPEDILAETEALAGQGGWREISLSSLSSGDYQGVGDLIDGLNRRIEGRHISFQFPSLKVSSFSLSLLEKISHTRKSGLTFAVETPLDAWQAAINKEVTREAVVEILGEAKKRGWRGAKFYFMIGLPPGLLGGCEEAEIADFIVDISRRANMRFNINIGIFVPKPHTPYERVAQIDSKTAVAKQDFLRLKLKPLGHKISVQDPVISRIEGILSRGDERAGFLAEEAFKAGSRLDAWSEYINKEKWLEILEENKEIVNGFLSEKEIDSPLPWQGIVSGVSEQYLRRELDKSINAEFTFPCPEKCRDVCGVCNKKHGIAIKKAALPVNEEDVNRNSIQVNKNKPEHQSDPSIYRVVFSFKKQGTAVFHGHLSLIEIFSMAFNRAGLPVLYTQGFNPLAKIEIAAPLAVGISAESEIAAVDFAAPLSSAVIDDFAEKLNRSLPEGILIDKFESYYIRSGSKKHSLSSLLWGFAYAGTEDKTEYIRATDEKQYRKNRLGVDNSESRSALFSLRRISVLAKNIVTEGACSEWASYFDAYRFLYPINS